MAIVSEGTMYKARIAPTYVSSNGYYGYVPPCPIVNYGNVLVEQQQHQQQQLEQHRADEANDQTMRFGQDWGLSSSTILHHNHAHHNNQQENRDVVRFNGSAMETDDDETFHREYVGVSRCQNNHCVIPETAEQQYERGDTRALYESIYRVTVPQNDYEATRKRGNRKRNSAGDPAYLIAGQTPADNTKKSRQDGGNGNFRNGARRAGKRGSSSLHYEQTSLIDLENFGIRAIEDCPKLDKERSSILISCEETAGNHDWNDPTKYELPCTLPETSQNPKFGNSYLDYEIMLMETHGCSAYHYNRYRHLDVALSVETEF